MTDDMAELKRWVRRHDITVTYVAVILTIMLLIQILIAVRQN